MIDHDALVHATNELAPLPASVMRMLALLSSDDWSIEDVVTTASLDAALTARILQVANSAASVSAAPVTTLEESTMRLGATTVVKLATGSAIRGYMVSPKTTNDDPDEKKLWRLSVATALAADQLASLSPVEIPREAFTVGLLNDIGRILLTRHLNEETVSLLERAVIKGDQSPLAAEREILSVDHAELGALIADHWGLPALIADSIRFHHTPMDATNPIVRTLCHVITVADAAARAVVGEEATMSIFDHTDSCLQLNLDATTFDELCATVGENLETALANYS